MKIILELDVKETKNKRKPYKLTSIKLNKKKLGKGENVSGIHGDNEIQWCLFSNSETLNPGYALHLIESKEW